MHMNRHFAPVETIFFPSKSQIECGFPVWREGCGVTTKLLSTSGVSNTTFILGFLQIVTFTITMTHPFRGVDTPRISIRFSLNWEYNTGMNSKLYIWILRKILALSFEKNKKFYKNCNFSDFLLLCKNEKGFLDAKNSSRE